VRSIVERPDEVEVETGRRRWRCASVVVAAGPWSPGLLGGAGVDLPLSVSRQSVAYFDVAGAPPVALMEFDGEEPYALWDPVRGLKAAFHRRGPTVEDSDDVDEPDPDTVERLAGWVRARFGRLRPRPAGAEACLYTNTADERFLLERRGRIVVASACNGQGFQHAPATGERVAYLALEVDEARV
jgi:sarcosine oxidase